MSSMYDCVTEFNGRKSEPYAVTESDITNAAQDNELVITENGVKIISETNGTRHICTPRTYPNRELWAASFYKPECMRELWKLEDLCDVTLFMTKDVAHMNDPYYRNVMYHVWDGDKRVYNGAEYTVAAKKWHDIAYPAVDDTVPIPIGKEVV